MNTIFNRYWICDSSGIGHSKWRYFVGDFGDDLGYAREHILETFETWANHGCSYSIGIELDVQPDIEYVEKQLVKFNELASHYYKSAWEMQNKLDKMRQEP